MVAYCPTADELASSASAEDEAPDAENCAARGKKKRGRGRPRKKTPRRRRESTERPMDMEKVRRLREAIQNGTFVIDFQFLFASNLTAKSNFPAF